MNGPIISDASPLIGLERIGRLDILARLYTTVVVPPAVAREVGPTITQLDWIAEQSVTRPLDPRIAHVSLGPGEREALNLALEVHPVQIVLDEGPARTLARSLCLRVIGTIGVLLRAKERGHLTAVRPILDALLAANFHLSSKLYDQATREAEE